MSVHAILPQIDMARPIPVASPIHGLFWSVVLPALLLAVAFVGTLLLYRRFASEKGGERG